MSNSDWKTVPGFCKQMHLSNEMKDKLSQTLAIKAKRKRLIERRATRSRKFRSVRWSYHYADIAATYRELRGMDKVLKLDDDEMSAPPAPPAPPATAGAEQTPLPPYHGADIIGIGSVILAAAALLAITAYIAMRLS